MPKIVYILTNPSMPGYVKIGKTMTSIEERMQQLGSSSGVPLPFECFFAAEVEDHDAVERALHEAFEDKRVRKNREFFLISPNQPQAVLKLLARKIVTPGADVVESADDQRALDKERSRRSKFKFSMIGLKPGIELQSVFDETITAAVVDDRHVNFRGRQMSPSAAALEVAREKGYGWTTIAGPTYWSIGGRTLVELRDDEDDDSDAE